MEMFEKIMHAIADAPHESFEHEHVHSSADAAKVRGTKLEEAAKALVLQTGSGKVFQCIVSGHRKLDMKKVKRLVGEKNISLAHPDKVLSATGCPIGTVPPFGNLFEPPMPVYADEDIFSRQHVVFSAGSHYKSIRMLAEDWRAIVNPRVVDISQTSSTLE